MSQSTECWFVLLKSHIHYLYSKPSTYAQYSAALPFFLTSMDTFILSTSFHIIRIISFLPFSLIPLALLLTPLSSLLPSKGLGIWSCAQMFASCESSAVSQVVSWSRCSDVSLPPSLPLRLCFLFKHQIAMMLFCSVQRVPNSWPPTRLRYHILGDGWKTVRSICRARLYELLLSLLWSNSW